MNLETVTYPTPRGEGRDIVDHDQDGGEGQPMIVARVFEEGYASLFTAAPNLLKAAKDALYELRRKQDSGWKVNPYLVPDLENAIKECEKK